MISICRNKSRIQHWIKKGLVFTPPENLEWMNSHSAVPTADHLHDDVFRIYFSGRDSQSRSQIGFFDIDIENHKIANISHLPILSHGKAGMFDESGSMISWLAKHDNTKYMYYIGWNIGVLTPFRNAIGLATSRGDSGVFQRYSKGPVLDRSVYDPCFVAGPCVLVEKNLWRIWYISCIKWEQRKEDLRHYYHIKYAESTDGIHWNRKGIVCIDFKSDDEYAISRPCVLKDDGTYKMWYSYRGESYRIGYAESEDGITWERKDEEVGLDVSESGWDSEMIEYPFVFDHKGRRYMLYNGNGYGKTGIGIAVLENGI